VSDAGSTDPVGSLAWARAAPASELFERRADVRRHLGDLTAREQWADVIELARLAEMPMARGSRWGAWEQVLFAALQAARRLPDPSAEAWALHQLGTRAMLRDDLATARPMLHDALARREALGERDASLITRHNLNLLPLALSGVMTLLTFFVGFVALVLPEWDDPIEEDRRAFLDIAVEVVEVEEGAVLSPVLLTNRGNVELTGLTLDPSDLFDEDSRRACDTIGVGDDCILVFAEGVELPALPLLVSVQYGGVGTDGDDAILVTEAVAD
jgi:hypothetical protein